MAYEALYRKVRPRTLAQLIGQEHIAKALTRAVSSDRLSHAHLLVGTRGTGKTSTARLLAKAMNCEKVLEAQKSNQVLQPKDIPCGKCPSCLSIDSSPDNVEFDAASNRSVDDVQRLLSTASMAPLQSRVKTFIIDEVHMLSFEAVNSILKLIEEPPPNVAFFLATTEFNKVPQTIRSRCQILNFHLIPRETIEDYLMKLAERLLHVELSPEAAQKISRLAAGSMRDAVTYIDQCYAMADKSITIEDVDATLGLISDYDLDAIIDAVQSRDREDLSTAVARAFRSGLSAVSIAESLISRVRDLEFELLKNRNSADLTRLENFAAQIRKTLGEMQYSGVPEIIFEMALMQIAAPADNRVVNEPQQSDLNSSPFEDVRRAFNEARKRLPTDETNLTAALKNAVPLDFSEGVLTLGFITNATASLLNETRLARLEDYFSKQWNQPIKIAKVVNHELENPVATNMNERDKKLMRKAEKFFN